MGVGVGGAPSEVAGALADLAGDSGEGEAGLGHLAPFCPRYHRAVELIGRRWSGVVVRMLLGGPRHFNALLAAIPGLSDRLLTERLRELQGAGVVVRRVVPGRPVRVAYELTPAGRALWPVVAALADWAETWLPLDGGPARGAAG